MIISEECRKYEETLSKIDMLRFLEIDSKQQKNDITIQKVLELRINVHQIRYVKTVIR